VIFLTFRDSLEKRLTDDPPIIARAFQLAHSGRIGTVVTLKRTLEREGYNSVHTHISGRGLLAQLKRICQASYHGVEGGLADNAQLGKVPGRG
jgi:hypothetical protein